MPSGEWEIYLNEYFTKISYETPKIEICDRKDSNGCNPNLI